MGNAEFHVKGAGILAPLETPALAQRHRPFLALRKLSFRPAAALREALREGYTSRNLASDVMAGVVVGMVALPLSMALAIASGVAPQHGLYTAIVAGAAIAVLGGSRVQVSGPTAAFVVILAPITTRFGLGGLMIATLMAGVMLFAMGAFRLGRLIEFIPHPVTTGFTAGIATVIATLQMKDFLGLTPRSNPEHYLERVQSLVEALPTAHAPDLSIGLVTLALLLLWPKVSKRVPPALVALSVAAAGAALAHHFRPSFEVATIASRFSGIPQLPPRPLLPWNMPGPDGKPLVLSLLHVRALVPAAFAIAMLGAIESLLSAVVSDGMSGLKHDPDAELMGQGIGNILSPFFGGIAATGAIARTATSVRAGARSPVAALVHALFLLAAVLLLAPALGFLPMASLAALLLLVAWNMSELRHFRHILSVAPKSDVAVLLSCYSLTVLFDMVVSVTFGVLLAAVLFMRRMAEISRVQLLDPMVHAHRSVPKGVAIYEIAGPLFFGAAQKAMSALARVDPECRVVILDLEAVPVLDMTGLVALESAILRLNKAKKKVVLAGVQDQPRESMERGHIKPRRDELAICLQMDEAVDVARKFLERVPQPSPAAG
jgi:SulP family sulfate permease